MSPRIITITGFKNKFYVENANALLLSEELFNSYLEEEPNILIVETNDIRCFRALSEKAGVTMSDWMQDS